MRKNVFKRLCKKVKNIEENWGDLESFVLFSTFGAEKHTLKMKEDFAQAQALEKVYQDLEGLQRADLLDFQTKCEEYGKFGKARRHIFC